MNKTILIVFAASCLFASCTRYAYFQSPLQNNTSAYKEVPLYTDSITSRYYASGIFSATEVNRSKDYYTALHGSLHRSHKFSRFQAYYGLSGSLGNYKVSSVSQANPDSSRFAARNYNRSLDDSLITANSGHKFFGSYGVMGGINFVHPWPRGEWRVIGVSLALNNEFGQYFNFRNKLPDSAANLIDRNRRTLHICVSTDFVAETDNGSTGYQLAFVINPKELRGYDASGFAHYYGLAYFTNMLHVNINQVTGFFQFTIGTFTTGMQIGANYRFGK